MPPQSSSRKAPASRVYHSEPRLRQRKFPSRTRFIVPSTEPPSYRRRTRQESQRTLTQLHWTVRSSHDSENEDDVDAADVTDEWQETRPKKKRKSAHTANATGKRQSTLTQIGFFAFDGPSEEEICETDSDGAYQQEADRDDEHIDWGGRDSGAGNSDMGNTEIGADRGERTNGGSENVDEDIGIHEIKGKDVMIWHDPTSDDEDIHDEQESLPKFKSPIVESQDPPFTPRKPKELEIPSSQSPAATPLTLRNNSPYKFQRSPLREMPLNVVAQLDMSSVRKPRRTVVEDSQVMDDADDEQFENFDPESDEELTEKTGVFRTPTKLNYRPQWSLKASRDYSQIFTEPPAFCPQRRGQASPEIKSHNAIPSSQATTVDMTQATPRLSPVQLRRPLPFQIPSTPAGPRAPDLSSPQIPPEYSPRPLSTPPIPFPSSSPAFLPVDSQFPTTGMDDITPMSEIQDSADIVTVSQLLPESMRGY